MAKMIPDYIATNQTKNTAEEKIFGYLKDDPKTKGWTVLHSLELASRGKKKPYGEIDFVVVVPTKGIICLEVKGGGIRCEDGKWSTIDRYGKEFPLKKSPFAQAKDSALALRESIIKKFGENSRESKCPTGRMVVFPDAECPPLTPEFKRWEVVDCNDLCDRRISSSIMKMARERLGELQRDERNPVPTPAETKKIVNFLRPDFHQVPHKGLWLEQAEEEMLKLTEEQYERIDQLEENPRCLFEGAAGTGKTLIALEFSRRSSKRDKKVALICYNNLLSQMLKKSTEDTSITTDTFHGVLEKLIMESSFREDFCKIKRTEKDSQKLFDKDYPFYGELALEELGPQFDLIVIDEAQDLCNEENLNILNLALKEGLTQGRWAIFGDFSRQTIYNYNKEENPVDILKKICGDGNFVRSRLTVNCRNTQRIADETYLLSEFERPPSRSIKEQGPLVEYEYWESSEKFIKLLEEKIECLLRDGISLEDIVVLSPHRLERSVLAGTKKISGFSVEDCSRSLDILKKKKIIKFSTIHSFKGLESRVVIVILEDVEKYGGKDNWQSLIYVSMSRAKSLLVLMVENQAKGLIDELRKKRIYPPLN